MNARWQELRESAPSHAAVRVHGRVQIELVLQPSGLGTEADGRVGAEVVAWAVLGRIPGALAYRVAVDPVSDAPPLRRWRLQFVPPESAVRDDTAPVQKRGELYYVAVDALRTWADDFAPEWEALRSRFEGASVSAMVTVPER